MKPQLLSKTFLLISFMFVCFIGLQAQRQNIVNPTIDQPVTHLNSAQQSAPKATDDGPEANKSPMAFTPVYVGYGTSQVAACSFSEARFVCTGCTVQTGVTIYWTPALTNPILYRTLLTDATGKVWNLNPSTGVIGTATGNYCP